MPPRARVSRRPAILAAALAAACAGGPARPHPAPSDVVSDAEAAAVADPHGGPGAAPFCGGCHARASGGALRAESLAVCRRCHVEDHASHPVGVTQARPSPGLPLDRERVVCATCHDPHQVRGPEQGLRKTFDELCTTCHRRGLGPGHH